MTINSVNNLYSNLKNSIILRKNFIFIQYSKLNILILKKLIQLGYITRFLITNKNYRLMIKIFVSYNSNSVLTIQGIKLLNSSSTKLFYLSCAQLKRLNFIVGTVLISTNKGILTKSEAILHNVGGLLLLSIW